MTDCFSCDSTQVLHVSILVVFSFLAVASVGFRLWARKIQRIGLEFNDYICVAGLLLALAAAVFAINSTIHWGLGSTSAAMDWPLVILQFKALLIGQLLWVAAVTFVRASVLLLYIRIFRTPTFRTACYVVHGVNVAYFIAVVLACCLICRPFTYNWDHSIRGTCGNQKSLDLFIGVFNLLLDVTTVILPMPVLWGLQMATSKKVVLTGMFSLGIVICAITLARIKVTTDINRQNAQMQYAMIALLTCLEVLLGVINACLPVMKPIFNKLKGIRAFAFLSTWGSTSATGRRSHASRSNSKHRATSRKRIGTPIADGPNSIAHKSSHPMFPQYLSSQIGSPTSSGATSPRRQISNFHRPMPPWNYGSLETVGGKALDPETEWDGERPASEDRLPMHPARQHNGEKDTKWYG